VSAPLSISLLDKLTTPGFLGKANCQRKGKTNKQGNKNMLKKARIAL
jgi:hypothetical protein